MYPIIYMYITHTRTHNTQSGFLTHSHQSWKRVAGLNRMKSTCTVCSPVSVTGERDRKTSRLRERKAWLYSNTHTHEPIHSSIYSMYIHKLLQYLTLSHSPCSKRKESILSNPLRQRFSFQRSVVQHSGGLMSSGYAFADGAPPFTIPEADEGTHRTS